MVSILLTSGTGKTGRRIAKRLAGKGVQARVASRVAAEAHSVCFDWADSATYGPALHGIGAIYLLAPANVADPLDAMASFLGAALARVYAATCCSAPHPCRKAGR